MKAGYFPSYPQIIYDYLDGVKTAIVIGPIIVLDSIPLNIITIVVGYIITFKIGKLFNREIFVNDNNNSIEKLK